MASVTETTSLKQKISECMMHINIVPSAKDLHKITIDRNTDSPIVPQQLLNFINVNSYLKQNNEFESIGTCMS